MAEKTTAFTGPVVVGLNDKKGEIRLTDGKNVNEAKYLSIAAPDNITSDTTLTFPNGAGTAGQILSTDGNGGLSWVNDSAGNPDGTSGQVQFNDNGTFGAIPDGTSGQVLKSNGAGVAPSFQTDATNSPGGSNTEMQFNDNGTFGAVSNGTAGQILTSNGASSTPTFQAAPAGGIAAVVDDTTPQLGGNLDLNSNSITGTGNLDIANGTIKLDGNYPTGTNNVALGDTALDSVTSGNQNTAIGSTALTALTTSSNNTAIGYKAGEQVTSSNNTFVGVESGDAITFGSDNTAVGHQALTQYNATGGTALGSSALKEAGGNSNIGIGRSPGFNLNGSYNILVGENVGYYAYNSRNNVVVGHQAFSGLSGNLVECTVLGNQACTAGSQSGVNNTIIGNGAQPSTTSVQNEITLGNGSISSLRCQVTSITALSDARDKKDVEDANIGLDFINDLRPVKFVWDTRDGAKKDIKEVGFIAQELDEVQQKHGVEDHLQLVLKNNPDKLEASQGKLIPILVQAIKDLKKEIDELKKA